ncbi:transposase [Streptomyces laurentii]
MTLFAAIIYVLVSGCAWRALPPCFGVSKSCPSSVPQVHHGTCTRFEAVCGSIEHIEGHREAEARQLACASLTRSTSPSFGRDSISFAHFIGIP